MEQQAAYCKHADSLPGWVLWATAGAGEGGPQRGPA